MPDPTFDELLSSARRGEEGAYASLWRRFNAPLLRYLRVMAGDDEAEDLASITWLEIVRGLHTFDGDEDRFRARLFTTARHRFFDARRNAGRRPCTVELGDTVDGADVTADPQLLVTEVAGTEAALAAIATLPPDQADVVMLRVVAGLDVATVARIVGKRPGNVRVLTHRGLQGLMAWVRVVEGAGGVTR
jgi:RNA polymerase sigma-70 factor (ECF subfamily)